MTCPHPFIASLAPDGKCPLCPAQVYPPAPWDMPADMSPWGAVATQGGWLVDGFVDPIPTFPAPVLADEREERRQRALEAESEAVKRHQTASGARAEKAYRSFREFAKQGWPHTDPAELSWSKHHEVFCDHIQWCIEDWIAKQRAITKYGMREVLHPTVIQRALNILFNVPPGTSKSRFIMVLAHAWIWLRYAPFTFKALSSSPRLSVRDGSYFLQVVQSDWYGTSFEYHRTFDDLGMPWIKEGPNKGKAWELNKTGATLINNTAMGERTAMGFNAKITGERSMSIWVDDPHDAEEVESVKERQNVIDRWDLAVWNRVTDMRTSLRFGVMQRLTDGDWSGHVLRQSVIEDMPKWCHVFLPAHYSIKSAKPPNAYGWVDWRTTDGELLDPVRMPETLLVQEKKRLNSRYPGQYEQDPIPETGGDFSLDKWRFFQIGTTRQGNDPRPKGCYEGAAYLLPIDHRGRPLIDWLDISVDCAFKKLEDGSNVGLSLIGGVGAYRFVFHDYTKPRSFRETCRDLLQLYNDIHSGNWLFREPPQCPIRTLIESKANGDAVMDTFHEVIPGIKGIEPEGGKIARANATSGLVDSGQVYLLDGMAWLDPYTYEFSRFPKGEKDDRVDAFSQALNEHGYAVTNGAFNSLSQF